MLCGKEPKNIMFRGLGPHWRLIKSLFQHPSLISELFVALRSHSTQNDDVHVHAAIDWLLLANQAVDGRGFAGVYSLSDGWGTAYPETSGYIIPTLIEFSQRDVYRREEIILACQQTGEWLATIQNSDGSYYGYNTQKPMVFDTGQVLRGLLALYQRFGIESYLDSAKRAGDWLISQQDSNGSWVNHSFGNQPHTYYSLVDVALIDLGQITQDDKYIISAKKHLDWILAQQQSNGWFRYLSFVTDDEAVLHTIAYTLQGLVESSKKLQDGRYFLSAQKAIGKLVSLNEKDILKGCYDANWQPKTISRCLTGLAQMGLVWKETSSSGSDRYAQAAEKVWEYLKHHQCLSQKYPNIYGGLSGSWPIWGKYLPWSYPNWAAKYFIDLYLTIQHK